MSHEHATDPGLALVSESLRERIAKHLAGPAPESNWSVIVADHALHASESHKECRDCDGLGFVALSEARLATFSLRIADMKHEAAMAASAGRLDREQSIGANIRGEYWSLNRESICKSCRGSGYSPHEGEAPGTARADGLFTTVMCNACRGIDARVHPSLMDPHWGTSCGESMARDDDAADAGDRCPSCLGAAYVVPITARPQKKGGDVGDYVEELDVVPVYHRSQEPADVLEAARDEDPILAAAVAILVGQHGDAWGKHQWGRTFALWPLTVSGRRLAEESCQPSQGSGYEGTLALCEAERLAEVQAERGDDQRLALLSMADNEARLLEHRAETLLRKAEAA